MLSKTIFQNIFNFNQSILKFSCLLSGLGCSCKVQLSRTSIGKKSPNTHYNFCKAYHCFISQCSNVHVEMISPVHQSALGLGQNYGLYLLSHPNEWAVAWLGQRMGGLTLAVLSNW